MPPVLNRHRTSRVRGLWQRNCRRGWNRTPSTRVPHGPAWTVATTAEALGVTTRTIEHIKRRFIEEGLGGAPAAKAAGGALRRRVRGPPGRASLLRGTLWAAPLDGPPVGAKGRGTGLGTECLADDRPADLEENEVKPHLKKYWTDPRSAAFVACMDDVPAVASFRTQASTHISVPRNRRI